MTAPMTPVRSSPVAQALIARKAQWAPYRGMPCAVSVSADDVRQAGAVGVCDVSSLERCGLKGGGAAAWLEAQGVPVPAGANQWVSLPGGGLVARLARTEFLVEDGPSGTEVRRIRPLIRAGIDGVTPVLRQDCALVLTGERVPELLVQTCNVDFSGVPADGPGLTLTQMVGVSVTVIRRELNGRPVLRLWCDFTSGPYLWETLVGIAEELGGGAVGVAAAWPELHAATGT